MHRTKRRKTRFFPELLRLESRITPDGSVFPPIYYPPNIRVSFLTGVATDAADASSLYGAVGGRVQMWVHSEAYALKSVTYTVSGALDASNSGYGWHTGDYKRLDGNQSHIFNPMIQSQVDDQFVFFFDENTGAHTITVKAIVNDILSTEITKNFSVTVEAPRVNLFQIKGEALVFGLWDDAGVYVPWDQLNRAKKIGFSQPGPEIYNANVTNNTHFAGHFGFVQLVDPFVSRTFSDGSYQ